MSAKPSTFWPSPCTTVAVRLWTHRLTSRAQLVLTTLGTTHSNGNASAASAASNAWAVLPRPGSSASRKVRCPCLTAATTLAWCGMSSNLPTLRSLASGSSMHAGAPGEACSKELSSGSISSHPDSRRVCGRGISRNSGAMNGLANCLARTEGGTGICAGPENWSPASAGASSGSGSRPPLRCSSRLNASAALVISASSWSSSKNDGSRAAVWARIVPMPSSRLSSISRRSSEISWSARTRCRSSRASRATT